MNTTTPDEFKALFVGVSDLYLYRMKIKNREIKVGQLFKGVGVLLGLASVTVAGLGKEVAEPYAEPLVVNAPVTASAVDPGDIPQTSLTLKYLLLEQRELLVEVHKYVHKETFLSQFSENWVVFALAVFSGLFIFIGEMDGAIVRIKEFDVRGVALVAKK